MNNNSITITGRVGKYIEAMRFPSNKTVLNFSVAVNDYKKTIWFDVQGWNELGDHYRELITKGREVTVSGRLTLNTYKDKNGTQVTKPVVILASVEVVRKTEAA